MASYMHDGMILPGFNALSGMVWERLVQHGMVEGMWAAHYVAIEHCLFTRLIDCSTTHYYYTHNSLIIVTIYFIW